MYYSGLSESEFLSSLEQFDKSSASWNVPLQRDWRVINHALNYPRYEMSVASIPASKVRVSVTSAVSGLSCMVKVPKSVLLTRQLQLCETANIA